MMADNDQQPDDLIPPIKRRQRMKSQWEQEGERSIGQNLAMMGTLGWLIVTPTLIGTFVGRLIDQRTGGGIFWTVSLLFFGVVVGGWLAWRKMQEP